MHNIQKLRNTLSFHFDYNKSAIKCFSLILLALLKVRTVNLVELSQGIGGKAKLKSKYRRLQRFISNFKPEEADIAKFIFRTFGSSVKTVYLALDRTNWKELVISYSC